ncbi:MAG TPA: primosomal protein N' [Bacilli bacterium]|nr:primosomal protein N' [Bacilli bacterium]
MYAEVLIQYGIKSLDHTFTYHIPESLQGQIEKGMKVYVPFGNQKINGFVTNIMDDCSLEEVKDIISLVTKELKLNDELLELGKYVQSSTLCTLITAYQTMLPTSLKVNNSKESYALKKIFITLNKSDDEINDYILHNQRALKQIEILNKLKEQRIEKKEINSSSLKKLIDLNIVKEEYESIYRINHSNNIEQDNKMTEEQENAFNKIYASLNKYEVFLLHGVTGSGKTEVYMHLCEEVIKEDKCIIVLVPEISLTTQLVKRFYNRFGNDVAIFHSELSDGEKYDEYKKIERKEVHIVVGTRSAIFTPINNLGLIIIDEEHSSTYKQENNPRYQAIDIAKWRAKYHNCPCVLGSATPKYESMARAQKGVYTYISMPKRVGNALLPKISIIDMKEEFKHKNNILSTELKIKIDECLNKHQQIMLLLNRRGYSTYVTCNSCGYTFKCPHCDVSLTYHKTSNNLRCHYCGYTLPYTKTCPNCHEESISSFGLGTEQVESLLKSLFPSARIIRMDADTTAKKGSHDRIIKSIENLECDIVIGTQMISKGLDFPNVTLVGIINADESLNIPDFRSGENTFALLSQVAGRAGRSTLPGNVIIQTFNPDNFTLINVLNNNYFKNYQEEMKLRSQLKYPPYYYIALLRITSKSYEDASKEVTKIANYLRGKLDSTSICLGPTPAPQFRINNIYRFQIIIKYKKDDIIKPLLRNIDEQYILNRNVNVEIDIDPIRL